MKIQPNSSRIVYANNLNEEMIKTRVSMFEVSWFYKSFFSSLQVRALNQKHRKLKVEQRFWVFLDFYT